MLAGVRIQMQMCLTCERPLIVLTVVLCIQIRPPRDTNKPHTAAKMSPFIPAAALPALDGKRKGNITCAGRYGKRQPMGLDTPRATFLQ